jgi:hypothetical protein
LALNYLSWLGGSSLIFLRAKPKQGDQIGGILAHWAIVYVGQIFKNIKEAYIFGLLFSTVQVMH